MLICSNPAKGTNQSVCQPINIIYALNTDWWILTAFVQCCLPGDTEARLCKQLWIFLNNEMKNNFYWEHFHSWSAYISPKCICADKFRMPRNVLNIM